jgi:hypothetical protein
MKEPLVFQINSVIIFFEKKGEPTMAEMVLRKSIYFQEIIQYVG